ncbi:hypothetical protein BGZ65_001494 [Modicella reniformis]|uniref:Uncharacterized protein n=1 Tax=Modicella reniformis TaxID=1440133 RepID=A0A9P6J2B2_9FUNG|nr:hypothetical protein BGZ65_001494 [Modicella reniformis]
MARFRATTDIERATLKKAVVRTVPLWEKEPHPWTSLPEEDDYEHPTEHTDNTFHSTSSSSSIATRNLSTYVTIQPPLPRSPSYAVSTTEAAWSVFSTMSNVSTMSERLSRKYNDPKDDVVMRTLSISIPPEPTLPLYVQSGLQGHPQRIFQSNKASPDRPANCNNYPPHGSPHQKRFSRTQLSAANSKRAQKHSLELTRGYPTGQCVSSSEPPPTTTWDQRDDIILSQERRFSLGTNTAFNIEAAKMFLNSPLFANVLKSLTVITAVLLFAMALDSIIILQKEIAQGDETPLSNASTSLFTTLVLSILTIAYCCFTMFRESRRLPEGLDSSNSKPLFVIFAEIITSIIWAQVLSVTIYIYIWTFGCGARGKEQLDRLWSQDEVPYVVDRLCRRGGTMVGLEVVLVLLLIFNFYTHMAQNFRFIRAVSQ